jgi:sulfate/thiosulfate transport system ATP-binding protein
MGVVLEKISKKFGDFVALDNIDLTIETGELVALLGPSGSGKTTLLRIIAGLEARDSGEVFVDGQRTSGVGVRDRMVGFVFQHYALFRHMTVFENVAFGLRVKGRAARANEAQISRRVKELLGLVKLESLADRYPAQLSGGQRQRVALARTLAVDPKILLLDEPFGALDAKVRHELRRWLRNFHSELKITSVIVTHDQEEALELADRIVVMNHGRIEQIGTPEEVYDHPANAFVYDFLGSVNLFHGRIENGKVLLGDTAIELDKKLSRAQLESGRAVVCVRPHLLEIANERRGFQDFPATIKSVNPAGPQVKVELVAAWGDPVQVEIEHDRYESDVVHAGADVFLRPKERTFAVYPNSELGHGI